MGGAVVSRLAIVSGGLLYPAYSSYKAVKGANVRQYVRWIMYWVVFALYTTIETFTDIFLSWLPFYYEGKMIFVLWLALPYTKGSSYLYRKFIHPNLSKREQEIDLFLENAQKKSFQTMVDVGSKGINMAANVMVTAAVKSQAVVTDKLRSYSVMDLTQIPENAEIHRTVGDPRIIHERHQMSASAMPMVTIDSGAHPGGDGRLTTQFKAYSMMNLSQQMPSDASEENVNNNMQSLSNLDDDYTSAPVNYTIDDMQITRRSNYAEESVPQPAGLPNRYYTMPRRKKTTKSNTKQMPPLPADENVVRRSRRTSSKRPVYYEAPSDFITE